jgi:hypothetical protein
MTLTAIVALLTGKTDTLTMADLEALSDFAEDLIGLGSVLQDAATKALEATGAPFHIPSVNHD